PLTRTSRRSSSSAAAPLPAVAATGGAGSTAGPEGGSGAAFAPAPSVASAAKPNRGRKASARKKTLAPRSHVADWLPMSLRRNKVNLLVDGAGVRVGCQSQGFAWQRQGTLRGNGPTPYSAGENIGRCVGVFLQLTAIACRQHNIPDQFMGETIIAPHQKELVAFALRMKAQMRKRPGRRHGKNWNGKAQHDVNDSRLGRRWNLIDQNAVGSLPI